MSLQGTRALFRRTMKYIRLFAFLMQSTTWLFHLRSLDMVTPRILAQSMTGRALLSTTSGEKLWGFSLKSIINSLHLSALSCISWDWDQVSTAVTTTLKKGSPWAPIIHQLIRNFFSLWKCAWFSIFIFVFLFVCLSIFVLLFFFLWRKLPSVARSDHYHFNTLISKMIY